MEIQVLRTDAEMMTSFPLMAMLRDRIREDTLLSEVRRQQRGCILSGRARSLQACASSQAVQHFS